MLCETSISDGTGLSGEIGLISWVFGVKLLGMKLTIVGSQEESSPTLFNLLMTIFCLPPSKMAVPITPKKGKNASFASES